MSVDFVPPGAHEASPAFRTWKKNSPFLYDLLATHGLNWPSLTLQFFPDQHFSPDGTAVTQRLLLGTHTNGQRDDFVLLAQLKLPSRLPVPDPSAYDEDRGEIGSYSARPPVLTTLQMIPHPGEVNRARYCPQNPDLIATRTPLGSTLVFDRTKHPSMPDADVSLVRNSTGPQYNSRPDLVLTGQEKEGYGLSWSPNAYGHILASSQDGSVAHWDLHQYQSLSKEITPLRRFTDHGSVVEDCAWHMFSPHVFASVGDSGLLICSDTRSSAPLAKTQAHPTDANAVAFAPASETVLATGGDQSVKLWDLRRLSEPMTTLTGHEEEVLNLAWSPLQAGLLASSGADDQTLIWDTSVGTLRGPPASPGPPSSSGTQRKGSLGKASDAPGLMFRHGGHTGRPCDVAWSMHDPFLLASVADDNLLQIWRPARTITQPYAWPLPSKSRPAHSGSGPECRRASGNGNRTLAGLHPPSTSTVDLPFPSPAMAILSNADEDEATEVDARARAGSSESIVEVE